MESEFERAGQSTYLRVNVKTIYNNFCILQSMCSPTTELIPVIKANAYGHGSVGVAKYLNSKGVNNFAVATANEGKELRENGVKGFIQVFGNGSVVSIPTLVKYGLSPTVASSTFLIHWAQAVVKTKSDPISVVIKVDTGMSRNGCQPDELQSIIQTCDELGVPVHSIMTHYADSWGNPEFTKTQTDIFMTVTRPFRERGVKLQAANSGAIFHGVATDLDFVRPGITIYGLAHDSSQEAGRIMEEKGFKPALTWLARPCLLKTLPAGRKIGYNSTYTVVSPSERLATFSFGYADGYRRIFSNEGTLTDQKGNEFPVVGRVTMDAVLAKVDDSTTDKTVFHVITDDYVSINSMSKMAAHLRTIPYEIGTSLATRLPRIFVEQ